MQTKRETKYVPANLPLQSISLKTPTEALGKFLSGARIPKHHIRCPSQEDAKPGQVEEILPALALLARLARNQRKRAKAEEGEPSFLQAFQESGAGKRDSNPRHPAWKAGALPPELFPLEKGHFCFLATLASLAFTMRAKRETLYHLYLEDFLLCGRVEGKKPSTLRWYKETLTPFIAFVNQEGLNQAALRKYINGLFDHLKVATIDNRIRAIKAFLRFLYKEGHIEEDLAATLKRPRLPKQFPHVLNDEQVMALLKAPNRKNWEGFRNYVMLLTFLDTGLRLSELLA
jgi:hypothetical protein